MKNFAANIRSKQRAFVGHRHTKTQILCPEGIKVWIVDLKVFIRWEKWGDSYQHWWWHFIQNGAVQQSAHLHMLSTAATTPTLPGGPLSHPPPPPPTPACPPVAWGGRRAALGPLRRGRAAGPLAGRRRPVPGGVRGGAGHPAQHHPTAGAAVRHRGPLRGPLRYMVGLGGGQPEGSGRDRGGGRGA